MQNQNSYKDGIAHIYKEVMMKTDFRAKTNVKKKADMELIVKLAFDEKSKRQSDVIFAEQMSSTLSLKIVTPFVNGISNSNKVIISDYLYDIFYIDHDKARNELYFYLEGVQPIAE
ncbi:phage head closure protein [Anaerosacchariphilus polymeriproducens]|uniref:Phage head-tail adapter protein n=1 Tax=Anaerosacchariphilus polymeriproducens TaxID=1812858 RepID=A0A371ARM3_9FIRM|nr:phage head closure protein [Anaerosacchariphilus polymeriproducens]RDU22206.1 hypothetical protein DWV06_16915 [Anaerosacchariphilus polymeriproducens]